MARVRSPAPREDPRGNASTVARAGSASVASSRPLRAVRCGQDNDHRAAHTPQSVSRRRWDIAATLTLSETVVPSSHVGLHSSSCSCPVPSTIHLDLAHEPACNRAVKSETYSSPRLEPSRDLTLIFRNCAPWRGTYSRYALHPQQRGYFNRNLFQDLEHWVQEPQRERAEG
jgi:hypothetical protein